MRDFVTDGGDGDHPDCLDLKVTGTIPFVDGARVLAIANGITRTNTLERFRALIEREAVSTEEADAWCDAYGFIQHLRMRLHQAQEQNGRPLENFQNPDDLSELDRRMLKESFRQERKLQSRLSQEYRA
jgi:CBS domain-containing protein